MRAACRVRGSLTRLGADGSIGSMSGRPTNGIWIADEDSRPHLSAPESTRPPIKLLLSLAGQCNLRCFHCLGASDELVRSSQDPRSASPELVDFIVDRVMPDVRALRLGGIGLTEELTSATFDYFMERIAPHAPRLGCFELITNLSLMTAERAERLAACLTDVQVSLEGIGDAFTRLRGFPWARLVEHLRMLREARRRNPASRLTITLLACALSDTLDDLLRFDVFTDLGVDRVILRELQPLVPAHEPHALYREPERSRAFVREFRRRAEAAGIEAVLTIADRYDAPAAPLPGDAPAPPEPARPGRGPDLRPCTLPFEVLSVIHTGQFGVCCYLTDLAGPSASLSTLSIMDVWNSPRFVALRRSVNSASPPPACVACEVKTGHLSEAERAQVRLPAELAEAAALRARLHAAEADRAARLSVIQEQGRRLGDAEAERNVLRAEVADLRRHLEAIDGDRAARLDVIRDQGRRLDEALLHIRDLREDALERRRLITVLTRRADALSERLRAIESTRAYRWLRRLGRWRFADEDPPLSPRSGG